MSAEPAAEAAPDITVLAGSPTPTELAAVTAVVTAMVQEASDADAESDGVAPSAWQHSQRAVRAPLMPGPNAWRGFSGR